MYVIAEGEYLGAQTVMVMPPIALPESMFPEVSGDAHIVSWGVVASLFFLYRRIEAI